MCIVVAKYIENYGWCGAKNRDRNYHVELDLIQSNRNDIQRLYFKDKLSGYTEGLNEFGVSILNAAFAVRADEDEGSVVKKKKNVVSTDGKKIRTALFEKTPLDALKILIQKELAGATLIFNEDECFILEAYFQQIVNDDTEAVHEKYVYKFKKIKKTDVVLRTNHGILLPEAGYQKPDKDSEDYDKELRNRKSTLSRYDSVMKALEDVKEPVDLLTALSNNEKTDQFMNPIRKGDIDKKEMRTSGQILLIPKDRSMHYRPLYSKITFDYSKLNRGDNKTFFEIASRRDLIDP